nr:thioredoxin domain-containing protein [Ardenticatena sp.]
MKRLLVLLFVLLVGACRAPAATDPTSTPAVEMPPSSSAPSAEEEPTPVAGRLAFMGPYTQNFQVFVMNADGSGVRLVSDGVTESLFPSLSPDGRYVVYAAVVGNSNLDIVRYDLETEERISLTNSPDIDSQPVYSPDGTQIAFVSNRDGRLGLFVMDADGQNVRRLIDLEGETINPLGNWSPDGQRLIFADTRRDGTQAIRVVDVETGTVETLVERNGVDTAPSFSPDGRRILFFSDRDGGMDVYVMDADGQNVQRLTNDGNSIYPVWQPDGNGFIFTRVDQERFLIHRRGLDEPTATQLPRVEGVVTAWVANVEPLAETGFEQKPRLDDALLREAPSKGDPNAPVTVVEFSDYQCPFCKEFAETTFPELNVLIEAGKVRFVWLDLPLETLHPNAKVAAEAAHCAREQGGDDAYWVMHDALFEAQATWGDASDPLPTFAKLAQQVGLDGKALRDCVVAGTYTATVEASMREAERLNVSSTPTFFIGDVVVSGAQPLDVFYEVIGEALGEELTPTYVVNADILAKAPAKGDPNAPITVVEFSDYQCPFCDRFYTQTLPQLEPLIAEGKVRLVYVDFPLEQIHPQARMAARAAHCAREQGGDDAYWAMHNLLFDNQQAWSVDNPLPVFVELALQAGLDAKSLQGCLESNRYDDVVTEGQREGLRLGVSGTPTFFIEGERLVGAQPVSAFLSIFERLLGEPLTEAAPTLDDATLAAFPAKGDPNAPITVVEFSDYQCPFCERFYTQTLPQLEPLIAAGEVRLVYVDFPLTNIHPQAFDAAQAAHCAREQGGDDAYWAMHNALFDAQAEWGNDNALDVFAALAAEQGLDGEALRACITEGRYADLVQQGLELGMQLQVTGTPTFFVEGERLVGAQPFSAFQEVFARVREP